MTENRWANVLGIAILVLTGLCWTTTATAQIDVWMDYTDFQARLDEATATAGVADFSISETNSIKANIANELDIAYGGYDVTFSEVNSGGQYETLNFGMTASPGFLGLADRIDFLNKFKTDVGRVFTANFHLFLDPSESRAEQLQDISLSIAGTAAHELGHNLGLQHLDPYGMTSFSATNTNGGYLTGGAQNDNIMATGSTGVSDEQRTSRRQFSDLSHVKLQFADGLSPFQLNPVNEQGAPHSTPGTAENIVLNQIEPGFTDYDLASVVQGFFEDNDFYSLDLKAGDKVLLEVFSEIVYTDNFDSILKFYDVDGTTLLYENDDLQWNEMGVNIVGETEDAFESMLWNLPITSDGRYFIELESFESSDTGQYDFLIAVDRLQTIPEPAAVWIFTVVALAVCCRRPLKLQN